MVFESLVVDVLNRFLGDYVVNVDSSQLKLGIWGGAVALKNLEIKENALSQLDVPFKVKAGHISQLNLQIPWQNLYTQPVEAVLDGVYLLIVPTASIKYDAEKEARQLLEARQRELQRIEEAKQKIADRDKIKEEKQDTFVEKLVTQVIKNLQLKISNIHIRYEDDITNRDNPLSFGISLQNLSLQLVRLDNLFAYWNVKSEMFYRGGYDESLANLKQGVASHNVIPDGYDFVFRPISAKAKLLMNPRSDVDFSSPKIDLDVNLQDITVEFNKPQYFSVMELLESIDMMTRNLPYRKYRPDVPVHNNAKIWWKYVLDGILEVNVQPKLQMWSWEHISHHRKQVKNYKEMYKTKITSKKPNEEILKLLEEFEKALDIFNITLARQQAEVEATKAGLKIYRPGVKQDDENSGGWFSWIWSWSGEKKDKNQEIKGSSLEELMTQEEKAKLYAAIGYSETAVDPTLPKSYEAMKFSVNLLSMSISIRENKQTPTLIEFALTDLSTVFTQRPGAQAIRFETKITSLEVTGVSQGKCTPSLLSSRTVYLDESTSLLSIMFETNPLDEKADQRIRIESQPLEIVYDAMTSKSRSDLSKIKVGQTSIEDIMSRAYDSFDVHLSSMQLLYSKHDENWREARKLKNSPQCILQPLDVKLEFSRAMVVTDARMPRFKLSGQLPLLSIQISDQKVTSILELIDSIPKPESAPFTSSPPKMTEAVVSPMLSAPHVSQGVYPVLDIHSLAESESEEEFYDALSSPVEDVPFFEVPTDSLKQALSTRRKTLHKQESLKNMTDFQLKFEVAEVLIKLCRLTGNTEMPVLQLNILGLGTELKMRTFDMTGNAFLREVGLLCPEYIDDNDKPVYIITTLDNVEDDLLTLEYIKADIKGPELKTVYQNVLQKIKVNFSSLDVHLHTEALLNAMNYLNNLLPKQETKVAEEPVHEKTEEKKDVLKKLTSKKSKYEDVVDLIICADLSCLSVFIREKNHRIAEIHIEGLDSQVIMKKAATDMTAKLKNIIIVDSDETALYKKALYITGKEVFNFRMVSYVNATDGIAYTNMDVVDNRIYLTVGCIQVVFVNKFVSSILAFINNFQAAKEALTEATVRTAEKAATGVKGLAERSSRLALDINIKAPVVIIPQSAMSANVLVADLGLITMKNQFFIAKTKTRCSVPPVIDSMTVKLSELKLYRSYYEQDSLQTEVQLLQPLSLEVAVERNLAAAWYNEVPDIEISGRLKPMNLILSQEDITTILRTLNENAGEGSGASTALPESKASASHSSEMHGTSQHSAGVTVVTSAVVELHSPMKIKTTLKLDFRFDSLTLVLYSPSSKQVNSLDQRDDLLKLAEFKLDLMSAALKMLSDGSMNASVKLANCTLDDKRQSIQKATPRMVEMKHGFEKKVMMDVNYKQGRDGTVFDVIVQEIYLCASMEFLLTVADIFLKAKAESAAAQKNLKQSLPVKDQASVQPVSTMEMNIVVKNPEIVFVADLTRSDAPALVVTTQCEVFIKSSPERYNMTAAVREIQMKACPFLPEERKENITTVLQPCDFFFEMKQSGTNPQTADLTVKSLTIEVSPIIINTVITITSALYQTTETTNEEISQIPPDLWNKKDIKNLKLWFLEETSENEDKNPNTELVPTGESLKINIESVFLTLEAGVGHRTVPMLLAKSSFVGEVKNWSTLINLHSRLELEVHYFNEMFGVWEPLLEPLEVEKTDLFKPWTLEIKNEWSDKNSLNISFQMKKAKKVLFESDDEEEENYKVPEYKTVINVSSKDQLNITLSKLGLQMLSNLGTAFAEAAGQTSDIFKKDRAPFVIINSLGVPITVIPSDSFSVLNVTFGAKIFHLEDKESLNMEFVRTRNESDQFTAMTTMSSKRFYIQICPHNHSTVEKIPLTKVGRCIYKVRHEESGVERSIVSQIDTVEGSKLIMIRSPVQGNGNKYDILQEGCSAQIHNAVLDQTKLDLQLLNYLDQNWRSEYHIKSNLPEISFTTFHCVTELDKTELDIGVHVTYTAGQMIIAIHSPYWMVNKTGRMLQYKADGIHRKHPPDYKKPLLFSFQPKNFLQNNKVGVTINNSSFNITRIVTFTPFFMISNRSKYTLEVAEEGKEKWIPIVLQQCIPFWPENDSNKLLVRVENSDLPPKKINFYQQENCLLLHLDNKLGGIAVDVNLTEHSTVITFSNYHDGAAPFLLINHTKEDIEYGQSSLSELEDYLQPNKAVLYTWADPTGSRKLKWRCGNRTEEIGPKEDKMDILTVDSRKAVYFMSFYEGLQRIVLITEDENVFKLTYESVKAELAEQEIVLSLQDVGISLVNNYTKQEVSYIGITSSDVVWEAKPKKKSRWRPMSVKQIDKLEQEFRDYSELSPSENKIIELESNVLVCLTPNGMNMTMQQPNEIPIRRNYLPALKVEYSSSAHQKSFRIQIYRIQLFASHIHYVILLYRIEKTLNEYDIFIKNILGSYVCHVTICAEFFLFDDFIAPKPFTDVSIVMRTAGHSQISHIKYFKVLIQEMDLRLDLGFLYAIGEFFAQTDVPSDQELQRFKKDVESLQEELMSVSSMDTSQISLYEYFHISPIKLHLSFSLSTGGEDSNKEERKNELIPFQSLNLLLKSIGATLTDVQDILFKLAFFELQYHFWTTQQLQSAVVRHYSKQAIKQMYILILGLDVLGNPFGFIRGLSEGVEAFFYEPYQGAIQGPEEFIEGMALGFKALVGGAVGGLAGAASRITGAMAKGVAAITMDEDYQQKRREAMNKQPTGLREGITRGGKGLVSGFVSGITGIVTKPIRGAQEEGAAGFFKGVGKGLVGAVARPTGGIIDMASSTFQGIKKVADSSEDVISLRPPRFFGEDGVIRPYRLRDGTGSQMLQKIENGRFAKLRYIAHAMVNSTDLLMVTKSGVLFVTKGAFGQLTCEWQYTYDEFTKEPFIVDGRRLRIEAKERVKSVFHAKEFGKIINFRSPEDAKVAKKSSGILAYTSIVWLAAPDKGFFILPVLGTGKATPQILHSVLSTSLQDSCEMVEKLSGHLVASQGQHTTLV
ncbi:vacuolar protein sorting 13 A [Turdus rufiventris]|nr:vacuolar protein sorting 13 A [Turdus rufiventris]